MSKTFKAVLSLALFLSLLLAFAPTASSAGGEARASTGWTRIATGGLGNPAQMMMFPLKEYAGRVYCWVPYMGDGDAPAPVWTYDGHKFAKACPDGFGDAGNSGITPGVEFQGRFYVGTANRDGAQLWRTPDGSHWERVGETVFTNPADYNCWPMGVQGGRLILGFENYQVGVRAWSYDGTSFARANVDGFGVNAYSLSSAVTFNGKVNVVVMRNQQGEDLPVLPLSYAGGTSWLKTGEEGLGDPGNLACHVIYQDGPYVYTGTDNDAGGQVWRYDGSTWTRIDIGAISRPQNNLVLAFPWQGGLYVSASRENDSPPQGPAQIYYRRGDGQPFETVTPDGFGDPANGLVFPGVVFDGQLLAGTYNPGGFQVWSGRVGPTISSLSPDSGAFGYLITIEGRGFGEAGSTPGGHSEESFVDFGGSRVGAGGAVSWTDTSIVVNVPEGAASGPVDVSVTTPAGESNSVQFRTTLSKSYYFAEGSTRDNPVDGVYDEYICLFNPGASSISVKVTYMPAVGDTVVKDYDVAAHSRLTVDAEADVGPERDISVLVESDDYFVAERSMYFDYRNKWNGGSVIVGATAPATGWYFAEGTTRRNSRDGAFEEWLCLMNPSTSPAKATIVYMLDGSGGGPVSVDVTVPAEGRVTRDVGLDVGTDADASAAVSSDVPIVVERPMYFDYHGKWPGGDTVLGATAASREHYFAEGCTYPWSDEWLCLANPTAHQAAVTVSYRISGGIEGSQSIALGPMSRSTVRVSDAAGLSKDVSLHVSSDHPILAERSMYFDYGEESWAGGTFATGSPRPRRTWYFAEGSTRSDAADGTFNEWVSIENTNVDAVSVKMTFLKKDGVSITESVQVLPGTRATVSADSILGPGVDASLVVEASQPVVVERPMYFDYHGFAQGGSVSHGYGF